MMEEENELIDPTEGLADDYIAYLEEYRAAGADFNKSDIDEITGDFAGYVRKVKEYASGIGLRDGLVPWNQYWLVRSGRILGTSRLRHRLTPALENDGGNIGYDIRPSERRKGYATLMLKLVLDKARALGLTQVLLTCDKDNIVSARVIEKNGGVLDSEGVSKRTGKRIRRYWIDL